ncbi:MAG: hypothetical protein IPK97_19300 [Ahniella sp.]|nr:hypothetical protein [Ahniella sp.]
MNPDPILALLKRRIGLDAESLGTRVIEDRLADLARHFPGSSHLALAMAAEHDRSVFDAVVAHFVVNESWLFRTPEQFEALQKFARRRPLPLNVLSLPAAHGEEPASIAVSLHEAGLQPADFRIVAGDIDVDALRVARCGRFPLSAFRGGRPDPRWFAAHDGQYTLVPSLLSRIEFRELNILDPDILKGESFDVIFCRNLLIYLHDDARAQVLALLRRVAAPDALVFTGTAEPQLQFNAKPAAAVAEARPRQPKEPMPALRTAKRIATPQHSTQPMSAPAHEEPPLPARLAQIEQRANQGDLAGACAALDDLIGKIAPSATAWYLRGVLASAQGDLAAAESALDRAAYLDPAHQPTLRLRAELARRGGHHDHADRLQAQLKRRRGAGRDA